MKRTKLAIKYAAMADECRLISRAYLFMATGYDDNFWGHLHQEDYDKLTEAERAQVDRGDALIKEGEALYDQAVEMHNRRGGKKCKKFS